MHGFNRGMGIETLKFSAIMTSKTELRHWCAEQSLCRAGMGQVAAHAEPLCDRGMVFFLFVRDVPGLVMTCKAESRY
jgi:hypothetical protein